MQLEVTAVIFKDLTSYSDMISQSKILIVQ